MKRAIIIGAGPAGLTAALELLRRTDIQPVVLEATREIGGISRTVRYKGNRMDIGGHRFFSKSDRVMQWWIDLMPPVAEGVPPEETDSETTICYQGKQRVVEVPVDLPEHPPLRGMGPLAEDADEGAEELEDLDALYGPGHVEPMIAEEPADPDLVMLIRPRKSRIYYLRRFFDYPIALSGRTLGNLGAVRTAKVGLSYLWSRVRQITPEKSLEDFLINRFGRELYRTFFKSYTEKVWGTRCEAISAEWGAQRIKGLSLTTAVKHFVKKTLRGKGSAKNDVAQKGTDTSLIERFMYPKLGPGQLWEHVAGLVVGGGGEVHCEWKVDRVCCDGDRVVAIEAVNALGERERFAGDYFFSTMPMKDLVRAMDAEVPANVRQVSEGLEYRDFITVGLLVDRLKVKEADGGLLKDTWIYVQEPDVQLGRLQIFNNWSPHLVHDPSKVWIGLEYFCYETDALWTMPDDELKRFAIGEVEKIGILNAEDVCDAHVVRVPKTYPAYFGTYDRFDELREFTDGFENLFLVGRNGMHKYNNQDHSMLTAMTVVDGLAEGGFVDKAALWGINTEQDYHEEKKAVAVS
ncbi:NAD(P)/FAD-dependent oxidoreductase [Edaphobacter aggregans]|uniref:NAD(P)/FAD-dependent oxidoreductase n=1 Tax=Edaphobacter aggregans TaxID=570835 RepID=UPI000552F5E7|nr:NAD(P)/FAD-dependent oxidoreductase [Edaphobacter aggregans]